LTFFRLFIILHKQSGWAPEAVYTFGALSGKRGGVFL